MEATVMLMALKTVSSLIPAAWAQPPHQCLEEAVAEAAVLLPALLTAHKWSDTLPSMMHCGRGFAGAFCL
jgi:hypothetical protein